MRNSEEAEGQFNDAAVFFSDIYRGKDFQEDTKELSMGLLAMATGFRHLSLSIRDLGDMLTRIEKKMAVTTRGPTGV